MIFEGKYVDGTSQKEFIAKIELRLQGLCISYVNESRQRISINWELHKILPNDYTGIGNVILKYGEKPYQYLDIPDPEFMNQLKNYYPQHSFNSSQFAFYKSSAFKGMILLSIVLIGLIVFLYTYVFPKTAEYLAGKIPIQWEISMGEALFKKEKLTLNIDEQHSEQLTLFFKKLQFKTQYPIHIVLSKNEEVNAYALPGGHIVIYEGILKKMSSYAELAALISHEFSHVQLRHATKSIFRQLSSTLFISLISNDFDGITATLIQHSEELQNLSYSRNLEEEADKNGLKLLRERNIDPNGIIKLFEQLKKAENGINIPKFMSSHPLTKERIEYIKKEIDKGNYTAIHDNELDSLFQEIIK